MKLIFNKKNIQKLFILFFLISSFFFTIFTPITLALNESPVEFTPLVTIPGSEFAANETISLDNSTAPLARYIKAIYNYGVGIIGILAAVMLMVGGLIWLTSGGSAARVEQAKEFISSSIVGLILVMTSWILLRTINPALVELRTPEVAIIEKLDFCCNPDKGNELIFNVVTSTEGISYECIGSAKKCGPGQKCMKDLTMSDPPKYDCIDLDKYRCCAYIVQEAAVSPSSGATSIFQSLTLYSLPPVISYSTMFCKPQLKETSPSCDPTHQIIANGYTLAEIPYSESLSDLSAYCAPQIMFGEKCLAAGQECEGKDNGDACKGTIGYCYNGECKPGEGKEGEQCGNDRGTCTTNGQFDISAIWTFEATCTDENMCHDGGGRSCGPGLYCCYPCNK